jgi:hypothetical protein
LDNYRGDRRPGKVMDSGGLCKNAMYRFSGTFFPNAFLGKTDMHKASLFVRKELFYALF